MARRRLQTGGAVASACSRIGGGAGPSGFAVPVDIDPVDLAMAIERKLSDGGGSRPVRGRNIEKLLETLPDGRIAIPQAVLEQLGGGVAACGERLLRRLIVDIRAGRIIMRSRHLSIGAGVRA